MKTTGYPELDAIYQMLDELQKRDDFDSRDWHVAARDIYFALNDIVDRFELMESRLDPQWDWLGENQRHPQWGERMKQWLLTSAKHTAYKRLLDEAHQTLVGSPETFPSLAINAGSSSPTPTNAATPSPVSGPSTATTGTPEPVGSLITKVRGMRRSSSSDALSASA